MGCRFVTGDPFTAILRRIPALGSVVLGKRKELHSITVDERHVLEIDTECARFLSKRIPKRIHMFPGELPTYEQHVLATSSCKSRVVFENASLTPQRKFKKQREKWG
jgi:hypothetical protein